MDGKTGKVIAVIGPTATGKTSLGINLAKILDGEVISADSRVIYRELNIGTAKPTQQEMDGVPHHMIDVAAPTESYSVARYREEATSVLETLLAKNKAPIVVGGTGFYIQALLQSGFFPDIPPDDAFRQEMQALAESRGDDYLHGLLREKDPERAQALHPNDRFRVIRALEIIHHTGQPVPKPSQVLAGTGSSRNDFQTGSHGHIGNPDICWIGLTCADRDFLRARIDRRIEAMLAAGWVEEVRQLLEKYGDSAEALSITHGYPELVQFVKREIPLETALSQIQINIHQYARRQITWFKRNTAVHWMEIDNMSEKNLLEAARNFTQM